MFSFNNRLPVTISASTNPIALRARISQFISADLLDTFQKEAKQFINVLRSVCHLLLVDGRVARLRQQHNGVQKDRCP